MLTPLSPRLGRLAAIAIATLFAVAGATPAIAADKPGAHDVARKKKKDAAAKKGDAPSAQQAKRGKHAKRAGPKGGSTSPASAAPSEGKLPALSQVRRAEPKSTPRKATKAKKKKSAARGAKKRSASKSGDPTPRAGSPARGAASHRRSCDATALSIDRNGLEGRRLVLTDCAGKPTLAARQELSVLARPWTVALPDLTAVDAQAKRVPLGAHELAPGVRLLDEGLVTRLMAIAAKFPHLNLSLVSGYRPESRGSLHQAGRAIDVRATGVSNQELAAFCRTLPDTGCGYYPNSLFVHIDAREPGAGSASWIDASGPGEPPHYVSEWPPRAAPTELLAPAKPYDPAHSDG